MERRNNGFDFTKIIATLALVIGVCILGVQICSYRVETRAQEIWQAQEVTNSYWQAPDTGDGSIAYDGLHESSRETQEIQPEVVEMNTTAYTAGVAGTGTVTADGSKVRYGIVASSRERLGWTAIVYENNDGEIGDVIGIFEVKDTGYGKMESNGKGSIANETTLDVYMETLDEVWAWMSRTDGKVWVQWVWCEG